MPTITASVFSSTLPALNLESKIIQQFGIVDRNITLRAGSISVDLVLESQLDKNCISLIALEQLKLPVLSEYSISIEGNQAVICPLIGILTSRNKKRHSPPFTSQNYLLQKLLNYCREKNYTAYVFSPVGVNQKTETVNGYYLDFDENGKTKWLEHEFPLPDVIYDRILHRSYENLAITTRIKKYLRDKKIPIFNPKFLNKWETYKILHNNHLLRPHLPETSLLTKEETLKAYLKMFHTVYIKPIHGSLGLGIMKVRKTPEGFVCQYRKKKQVFTELYPSFNELFAAVNKQKGKKSYIIQHGLNMLKYHDQVFDIRVLAQKNGRGEWGITAEVARLAGQGSIFPNIAAGGEARNLKEIWPDLTSADWQHSKTKSLIEKVSLESARQLESSLGTLGEVGLDIGVDSQGHIWIIEINSKPSRKVFAKDQMSLKKLSIQLPMDYAAFLCKKKGDS